MKNNSHIFKIAGQCAIVAAVVIIGIFTVGVIGAIALGAGVSVAVFYSDAKTPCHFHWRKTTQETVRATNDKP